jgi:hypothetical protein
MRTETRWPSFAREAQQRGVLSSLSFQLFLRSENLGALNLYSDEPGAFSEESVLIGEVLAQHAAVAMIGVANVMQFRDALASRDLIGQAKGMVMQRQKLTGIQAFNLLIAASQETNIKLVDVARWLVAEHESHSEATPHGTASGPAKSFSPQPGRPRVTDTDGPQLPRCRRDMADSARDRAAGGDRAEPLNEQVAQGHQWAAHAEPDSSGDLHSDAATKHRRAAGDDRRDAQTAREEADTEHDCMAATRPAPGGEQGRPDHQWASVRFCCASQRASLSTPSSMSATVLLRSLCGNARWAPVMQSCSARSKRAICSGVSWSARSRQLVALSSSLVMGCL